jgi:hypothetical protein
MGHEDQTARTELLEQYCQLRAAKIRQPGQDRKERRGEDRTAAITGQLDRTTRSVKLERNSKNRTSRTGQADRRDRTALSGQYW